MFLGARPRAEAPERGGRINQVPEARLRVRGDGGLRFQCKGRWRCRSHTRHRVRVGGDDEAHLNAQYRCHSHKIRGRHRLREGSISLPHFPLAPSVLPTVQRQWNSTTGGPDWDIAVTVLATLVCLFLTADIQSQVVEMLQAAGELPDPMTNKVEYRMGWDPKYDPTGLGYGEECDPKDLDPDGHPLYMQRPCIDGNKSIWANERWESQKHPDLCDYILYHQVDPSCEVPRDIDEGCVKYGHRILGYTEPCEVTSNQDQVPPVPQEEMAACICSGMHEHTSPCARTMACNLN